MSIFKCKICGGSLEITPDQSVAVCEYCGTKQTLPRLDGDRKAMLYDRADHFRRNNDYDKATGIYEQILNEDPTDAESYWSLVLCRYGIEYVEDPETRKRVTTVNRTQFTSIFDDEDYKSALRHANAAQKEIYEEEAAVINEIQKGILAISQQEAPFDVFICYKETDSHGRRTQDSVLATELYHELTREGFRVFFSRITLEDKLGVAYEPYIFAALNSAKVMVVLGTRPEHFQAVWVRNEWSRYLSLMKNGAKKALIPAYRSMDPYDLPDEFSHLQAQDMSKLGFMQDLVHGIKKYVTVTEPVTPIHETIVAAPTAINVSPLIKRAFLFLEDGEFDRADSFFEQVLNQDPENSHAYLGKLMIELSVKKQEDLSLRKEPFDNNKHYQKALRFADAQMSATLKGYIAAIQERKEKEAEEAKKQAKEAKYQKALFLLNNGSKSNYDCTYLKSYIEYIESALTLFKEIPDWKDSKEKISFCQAKIEEYQLLLQRQEELRLIRIANTKKIAKKTALIGTPILLVFVLIIVIWTTVIVPKNHFTIQCDLAGGNLSNGTTFDYYTWDKTFTLYTPTRQGYTFIGWTGTDLSAPTMDVTIPKGSKGDRSYTANWQANTYTVTLDPNGGTCDVTSITVTYDQPFTLPKASANEYALSGWFYNDTYFSNGIWQTDSDITLTAEWYDSGLSYTTDGTNITITDYTGGKQIIVIPKTIGGQIVTTIGEGAFQNCDTLISVDIPHGVTTIQSYAFKNCTNLADVTIPDSVKLIHNYSFQDCTSLTDIIIPGSVTGIGSSAFQRCIGLTKITIPESVTFIGSFAFAQCSSLEMAIFEDITKWEVSRYSQTKIISVSAPYTAARDLTENYYQCEWVKQ